MLFKSHLCRFNSSILEKLMTFNFFSEQEFHCNNKVYFLWFKPIEYVNLNIENMYQHNISINKNTY